MKAAILYGKEQIRIEEIPEPELRPGEVRLRIEAALTCGTDLKVYRRGYHAKMIRPPAVFGHEMAGVVTEIGPGVAGWEIGDRVVVANSAPCGVCFFCRNDQENLCDDLLFLNGAYAESIVVPPRLVEKNMLRLKPDIAFVDAALAEPLACVVQGVEETRLRQGQRVLVIGAGPIGLMFARLARQIGCEVAVAGRSEHRLNAARRLGATAVVDVGGGEEISERVRAACPGEFDVVIEAVGKPETWQAAIRLVRKGGVVNLFGGCPAGSTVTIDPCLVHYSNLTLLSSFHHSPKSMRRALDWIEERVIRAADFVDGSCRLDHLPELFRTMASGNRSVKTAIQVR